MHHFLHVVMHISLGAVVLSGFSSGRFFFFLYLFFFFGQRRLGSALLFRRIGHEFGESFSNALLPAKGFTFLKECFIKRGYSLGQGFNLQQQPVVVSP